MGPLTTLIIVKAVFSWLAVAETIEFFYTETLDTCSINGVYIQANEQTTHGGVCAYRQDVDRVYGCPAPDPTCWTWAQECNESGIGQTVCNRGGTVFCCNAVAEETCTTTEGQINVCISNFSSPNSGVNVQKANDVYLAAIGVQNVTATSQISDPTPFSTEGAVASSTTTSILSSSSENTSSTTSSEDTSVSSSSMDTRSTSSTSVEPTAGTRSPSATNGLASTTGALTSPTADSQPSNGSTPPAIIAGIVVGVLLLCALVGAVFFFLGRRRTAKASAPATSHDEAIPFSYYEGPGGTREKAGFVRHGDGQSTPSELGSDGISKYELAANDTSRHELP